MSGKNRLKSNLNKFDSKLGRSITSIQSAKKELYHPPIDYNPREYIDIKKGEFFGIDMLNKNPIYTPPESINHKLFCGITRSGKGVLAGVKIYEVLQHKNKGLIYIDVKNEDFTPQIILEELERQNRKDDFILVKWSNDFCYDGFNDDDSVVEVWEKLCIALDIGKTTDPAVDHYRLNQRATLFMILERYLKIEKRVNWYLLLELIRKLFKKNVVDEDDRANDIFGFTAKNKESLEMLSIKIFELLLNAQIYHGVTLDEALYNGKVIYINADMENQSSLQFLKMLFKDISQKIRKKKANCDIFADEISFYATSELAGMLSTNAGFGIRWTLMLQDLAQIENESLKNSILTNCSAKMFYKITDLETLEYVKKLGGDETVTTFSSKGTEAQYGRELEPLLNSTRIRAMWYKQHGIFIAEYFNTAFFIHTSFIPVKNEFDWNKYKDFKEIDKNFENEVNTIMGINTKKQIDY